MALRNLEVNWKYIKSFATEANLHKYIAKVEGEGYSDVNDRYVIVRTPEGRWTAIVRLDSLKGGYVGRYTGFLKI